MVRSALPTLAPIRTDRAVIEVIFAPIVKRMDALNLLKKQPWRTFDYIFIAPPQYKELWISAIKTLDENLGWLSADGWVIVQIDPVEYGEIQLENLEEFDMRRYGSVLFVFFHRINTQEQENINDLGSSN